MSQKKEYLHAVFVIAALFLLMYILNNWMPLHRDDYDYSLIWGTSQHVASWRDVLASLQQHYLLHGGRMVSVFFLDAFLFLGKFWFDLVNAALFAGLVVLIYLHACRSIRWWKEPGVLAATALLAWLSFPHFGEVAIWKSGSTVYLWAGFLVFLFLLPYNLQLAGKGKENCGRAVWAIPMFLLGITAGWSVENLAVTVTLLAVGLSYWAYRQGQMPVWMPAGAAGAFLGFVGILAAPGNYVRYGEQGSGKGILTHIGNQFAGNGEMLLYLLPLVLLLLLTWRMFKLEIAVRKGLVLPEEQGRRGIGRWLLAAFLLLLVVSYFNGGFVANGIRDFLIAHVMAPLHLIKENTIDHFANVMAGFEEMAIYWLSIFFLYSLLKEAMGLSKKTRDFLREHIPAREVWQTFPEVRYAGILFGLAFFNNLVMLGAPTFPARATFGSVVMILIGGVAILRSPVIWQRLQAGRAGHVLQGGALALGVFTVAASLVVMHTLQAEDALRLSMVKQAVQAGQAEVSMPPIELKNRALRHIFYVDFDNGVTKNGLCHFYGLKDIHVEKNP